VTWAKLDDKFWSNPKVEAVGNEAAGAFARMLSYCGDQLTDGRISEGAARFIARPKTIERLVEFGFIAPNGSGYVIPDFLEYNKSKAKILETRAADRKRKGEGQ
jgi:hypothetical protein